eukprot:jgi/Galph1/1730/GphlegSOOS_G430.1
MYIIHVGSQFHSVFLQDSRNTIHSYHSPVLGLTCRWISERDEKDSKTRRSVRRKPWPIGRFIKSFLFFNPIARAFSQEVAASGQLVDPGTKVRMERIRSLTNLEQDASYLSGRTIFVIGATGRVGRKIVLKLQKAGCKIRALVRDENRATTILAKEGSNLQTVQLVTGDLHSILPEYFNQVFAVICVMGIPIQPISPNMRSTTNENASQLQTFTQWKLYAEMVEYEGVKNLVHLATDHFKKSSSSNECSSIEYISVMECRSSIKLWGQIDDVVMGGVSQSKVELSPSMDAITFSGEVSTDNFGGFASTKTLPFETPVDLSGYDGIYLQLLGDGKRYKFIIRCDRKWDGIAYCCSVDTINGTWKEVWLPFKDFKPVFRAKTMPTMPMLDASRIYSFQLMLSKFEYDQQFNPNFSPGLFSLSMKDIYGYRKVSVGTETPQFIYLSAAQVSKFSNPNSSSSNAMPGKQQMEYLFCCKYRAEEAIRSCPLRYTIIRPCAMTDTPAKGCSRLLVDQGDQLTGTISRKDVVDICFHSLLYASTSNTTFEVAENSTSNGAVDYLALFSKLETDKTVQAIFFMTQSTLTLFYEPGSPPCRAVLMFILENGIPHELKRIKLFEKEHLTAEYENINPFKKVPSIRDGDFTMGESHAIMKYLIRTRSSIIQEHWYPSDPEKRAKVDELLDWHHSSLSWSSKLTVWNAVMTARFMKRPEIVNPTIVKFGLGQVQSCLSLLDRSLAHMPYLIKGLDKPTIGDVAVFAEVESLRILPHNVLRYVNHHNEPLYFTLKEYPNVMSWLERMRRLKSYKEVHRNFDKVVAMIENEASNHSK